MHPEECPFFLPQRGHPSVAFARALVLFRSPRAIRFFSASGFLYQTAPQTAFGS